MHKLRNLREVGLVLCALMVWFAAASVAEPVLSESEIFWKYKWIGPRPVDKPSFVTSQWLPNGEDCAAVKLDVWIKSGRLTYSLFNDPDTGVPSPETTSMPGRMTMLVGGKNCRFRVVIERAEDSSGGN